MKKIVYTENLGDWEGRIIEDNLDNAGPSYWPALFHNTETTSVASVTQSPERISWASDNGYSSLEDARKALNEKINERGLRDSARQMRADRRP